MRYAVKLAYVGSNYFGFQRQSSRITVEGVLLEAMRKAGLFSDPREARYCSAGRTDRGVHALSQVVAFNSDKLISLPRINALLPMDVRCWAYAVAPENFNPRRDAMLRTYKYYSVWRGEELARIREAASLLVGTHDFKNFCRPQKGESTVRTLHRADVEVQGEVLCFTFSAKSFLWGMVRKMVSVLLAVGAGLRDVDFVSALLNPDFKPKEGIKLADPEGLVLYDIKYPLNFNVCEKSKNALLDHLKRRLYTAITLSSVYRALIDGVASSTNHSLPNSLGNFL
ncbi:MAG: tRNA pseudouridine(38-40) synthase TruA [Candidatus Freyarchaeota archaeon]|nr:tRNA pseudouridine(38-40) synthase TruA [Candidatus Jordarchaeia archaeon]